jgi:two-component system sensor histidine kinase/response regulator
MEQPNIVPENYTILVVDDIDDNILLLNTVLSRVKYKVISATRGAEALEKINTVNPDLILLDVMMPDIDGFEVLRRLKEDPEHRNIPVIMLTALHDDDDMIEANNIGASDYITKPFKVDELLDRVNRQISLIASKR